MFKKLVILGVIALMIIPGIGLVSAQYDKPAGFLVTFAPKPAGEDQGWISDPDVVYLMNPGQEYLPMAIQVTPGAVTEFVVTLEGTAVVDIVEEVTFVGIHTGLFLANFPLGWANVPPGVYHVLFNGYHGATIQVQ